MELPKRYDHRKIEDKWRNFWEEKRIYKFDRKTEKPVFSIDTPPPYPSSGEFHMGNVLNWTYFDVVARYYRMKGYEVLFPQGWDCHGLPTEVQAEKKYGIKKGDIPREEFRNLCIELTRENIKRMKSEILKLGYSIDWSTEYETMSPDYWRKTQLSFILLYRKGLIYRGEHPVDWCPRCQTAIAHAEVEYESRSGELSYILFDDVEIATTRPELLCSCVAVAVHPEDERYKNLGGKRVRVPIYGKEVEVLKDSEVDPEFGTGIVMICTYGDRTDVKWVKRYGLEVIQGIDEEGRMTDKAGKYEGMEILECREEIISDLEKSGKLRRREKIQQKVGVCWRCKTPVEILPRAQWFMDVTSWKDEIIKAAERVRWVPDHMRLRLQEWAGSLDWDWVISRQRFFATPIPVWYCGSCGAVRVAEEGEIPIDPSETVPSSPCRCGKTEWVPERDVFDTWMDSSITCAVHAGWPDFPERFRKAFPADLQPNGTDIIRTWDYYLLVKHLALFGEIPYKTVLINGMVVGEDGRKMSKSLGNFVTPSEAIEKYGADAVRQWAILGGSPGSDIPFKWKDVIGASRFLQKLWSILRFSARHVRQEETELMQTDQWILSELNSLILSVTKALDGFKFDSAMRDIRRFAWEVLADEYIELAKWRLYAGDEEKKKAAQNTLFILTHNLARLLAPFLPFFAEELWSVVGSGSVHNQKWPSPIRWEPALAKKGKLIKDIVSSIRRYKAARGLPLNHPLGKIKIYSEVDFQLFDIAGASNAEVEVVKEKLPEPHIRVEGALIYIE
jgi:valyl-tRNA synthetase